MCVDLVILDEVKQFSGLPYGVRRDRRHSRQQSSLRVRDYVCDDAAIRQRRLQEIPSRTPSAAWIQGPNSKGNKTVYEEIDNKTNLQVVDTVMTTGLFKSPETIAFACEAMRSKFLMADKYEKFKFDKNDHILDTSPIRNSMV